MSTQGGVPSGKSGYTWYTPFGIPHPSGILPPPVIYPYLVYPPHPLPSHMVYPPTPRRDMEPGIPPGRSL